MADPAALRTRRYRLHRRGDHSLCVGCDALTGMLAGVPADPAGAGKVSDAVQSSPSRRPYHKGDPRGVMRAIATRLALEVDRNPGPGMARELSGVINHLGDSPDLEPDRLDEVRTRMHARRLATMLQGLNQ